eukprot:SAG31_NODE_10803_length_1095_cov_1.913655_1_plen_146_part_01
MYYSKLVLLNLVAQLVQQLHSAVKVHHQCFNPRRSSLTDERSKCCGAHCCCCCCAVRASAQLWPHLLAAQSLWSRHQQVPCVASSNAALESGLVYHTLSHPSVTVVGARLCRRSRGARNPEMPPNTSLTVPNLGRGGQLLALWPCT